MKKRTKKTLGFKKFQVAKIENPRAIFGGDGGDDVTITVPILTKPTTRKG